MHGGCARLFFKLVTSIKWPKRFTETGQIIPGIMVEYMAVYVTTRTLPAITLLPTLSRTHTHTQGRQTHTHTHTHKHTQQQQQQKHTQTHTRQTNTHTHTHTHTQQQQKRTHTHNNTHQADKHTHTHTHIHTADKHTHTHTHTHGTHTHARTHAHMHTHTHTRQTHTHKPHALSLCHVWFWRISETEYQLVHLTDWCLHPHTHTRYMLILIRKTGKYQLFQTLKRPKFTARTNKAQKKSETQWDTEREMERRGGGTERERWWKR